MSGRRRPGPTRMIPLAAAVAALALGSFTPATAAPNAGGPAVQAASTRVAEARGVVAKALARYESSSAYRIDFTQESYWALADSTTVASGTLFYERPGRMSLTYGDGSRIVVQGDSMRVYTAQTAQFFVVEVDSTDVAIDPPRLLRAYTPDPSAPFAAGDPLPDGSRVVSLKPQQSFGEPTRIEVTIDPASGRVTRIAALSSSGDRMTYAIRASSFGVDVPEGEFILRRPANATLVKGSPF